MSQVPALNATSPIRFTPTMPRFAVPRGAARSDLIRQVLARGQEQVMDAVRDRREKLSLFLAGKPRHIDRFA